MRYLFDFHHGDTEITEKRWRDREMERLREYIETSFSPSLILSFSPS